MFNNGYSNQSGNNVPIRRIILFIVPVFLALALILGCITFQAWAFQGDWAEEDEAAEALVPETPTILENLAVVQEISLGDQGIFPAGHTLATVHADGEVYTVDVEGVAGDDLAEACGYTLENQDFIEQAENEYGFDIYVNRQTVETTTEEIELAYETVRVADASMKKGVEEVTTEGQTGLQVDTYEVRTLNGETTTTLVGSEVVTEPVNEVITYGTNEGVATGFVNHGSSLDLTSDTIERVDTVNKTFTTTSGQVYSYSSKLQCTGYAYCIPGGTTATGTKARQGAVAVDPSVIPLGSKLFIVASDGSVVYGVATAEDTGGNIKGNKVDLFYNSNSLCVNFGRRSIDVYILD